MSAIIKFFQILGKGLIAGINFLVDIVRDIIWLVEMLVELSPAVPSFYTFLPPGFIAMMTLTIAIVVILRILGRSD